MSSTPARADFAFGGSFSTGTTIIASARVPPPPHLQLPSPGNPSTSSVRNDKHRGLGVVEGRGVLSTGDPEDPRRHFTPCTANASVYSNTLLYPSQGSHGAEAGVGDQDRRHNSDSLSFQELSRVGAPLPDDCGLTNGAEGVTRRKSASASPPSVIWCAETGGWLRLRDPTSGGILCDFHLDDALRGFQRSSQTSNRHHQGQREHDQHHRHGSDEQRYQGENAADGTAERSHEEVTVMISIGPLRSSPSSSALPSSCDSGPEDAVMSSSSFVVVGLTSGDVLLLESTVAAVRVNEKSPLPKPSICVPAVAASESTAVDQPPFNDEGENDRRNQHGDRHRQHVEPAREWRVFVKAHRHLSMHEHTVTALTLHGGFLFSGSADGRVCKWDLGLTLPAGHNGAGARIRSDEAHLPSWRSISPHQGEGDDHADHPRRGDHDGNDEENEGSLPIKRQHPQQWTSSLVRCVFSFKPLELLRSQLHQRQSREHYDRTVGTNEPGRDDNDGRRHGSDDEGHDDVFTGVTCLESSPFGLVTNGLDGDVLVWPIDLSQAPDYLHRRGQPHTDNQAHPDQPLNEREHHRGQEQEGTHVLDHHHHHRVPSPSGVVAAGDSQTFLPEPLRLRGHGGPVLSLLSVGASIWAGCEDGTVRVWRPRTADASFDQHRSTSSQGFADERIPHVSVVPALKCVKILRYHQSAVHCLTLQPAHPVSLRRDDPYQNHQHHGDAARVWSASMDGLVAVWNAHDCTPVCDVVDPTTQTTTTTAATASSLPQRSSGLHHSTNDRENDVQAHHDRLGRRNMSHSDHHHDQVHRDDAALADLLDHLGSLSPHRRHRQHSPHDESTNQVTSHNDEDVHGSVNDVNAEGGLSSSSLRAAPFTFTILPVEPVLMDKVWTTTTDGQVKCWLTSSSSAAFFSKRRALSNPGDQQPSQMGGGAAWPRSAVNHSAQLFAQTRQLTADLADAHDHIANLEQELEHSQRQRRDFEAVEKENAELQDGMHRLLSKLDAEVSSRDSERAAFEGELQRLRDQIERQVHPDEPTTNPNERTPIPSNLPTQHTQPFTSDGRTSSVNVEDVGVQSNHHPGVAADKEDDNALDQNEGAIAVLERRLAAERSRSALLTERLSEKDISDFQFRVVLEDESEHRSRVLQAEYESRVMLLFALNTIFKKSANESFLRFEGKQQRYEELKADLRSLKAQFKSFAPTIPPPDAAGANANANDVVESSHAVNELPMDPRSEVATRGFVLSVERHDDDERTVADDDRDSPLSDKALPHHSNTKTTTKSDGRERSMGGAGVEGSSADGHFVLGLPFAASTRELEDTVIELHRQAQRVEREKQALLSEVDNLQEKQEMLESQLALAAAKTVDHSSTAMEIERAAASVAEETLSKERALRESAEARLAAAEDTHRFDQMIAEEKIADIESELRKVHQESDEKIASLESCLQTMRHERDEVGERARRSDEDTGRTHRESLSTIDQLHQTIATLEQSLAESTVALREEQAKKNSATHGQQEKHQAERQRLVETINSLEHSLKLHEEAASVKDATHHETMMSLETSLGEKSHAIAALTSDLESERAKTSAVHQQLEQISTHHALFTSNTDARALPSKRASSSEQQHNPSPSVHPQRPARSEALLSPQPKKPPTTSSFTSPSANPHGSIETGGIEGADHRTPTRIPHSTRHIDEKRESSTSHHHGSGAVEPTDVVRQEPPRGQMAHNPKAEEERAAFSSPTGAIGAAGHARSSISHDRREPSPLCPAHTVSLLEEKLDDAVRGREELTAALTHATDREQEYQHQLHAITAELEAIKADLLVRDAEAMREMELRQLLADENASIRREKERAEDDLRAARDGAHHTEFSPQHCGMHSASGKINPGDSGDATGEGNAATSRVVSGESVTETVNQRVEALREREEALDVEAERIAKTAAEQQDILESVKQLLTQRETEIEELQTKVSEAESAKTFAERALDALRSEKQVDTEKLSEEKSSAEEEKFTKMVREADQSAKEEIEKAKEEHAAELQVARTRIDELNEALALERASAHKASAVFAEKEATFQSTLEEKDTEHRREESQLRAAISDAESAMSAAVTAKEDMSSELQRAVEKLTTFDDLQTTADQKTKAIDDLQRELTEKANIIEELQRAGAEKDGKMENERAEFDEMLRNTESDHRVAIATLNDDLASAKEAHTSAIAALEENLSELNASLDKRSSELEAATEQLSELQSALSEQATKIDDLVEVNERLESEKKSLEDHCAAFDEKESVLRDALADTEGQLNTAEENSVQLSAQLLELRQEEVRLQEHIEKLTEELLGQTENAAELSKHVDSLSSALEAESEAREEATKACGEISTKHSEDRMTMTREIDDLRQKIDAQRSQYEALIEEEHRHFDAQMSEQQRQFSNEHQRFITVQSEDKEALMKAFAAVEKAAGESASKDEEVLSLRGKLTAAHDAVAAATSLLEAQAAKVDECELALSKTEREKEILDRKMSGAAQEILDLRSQLQEMNHALETSRNVVAAVQLESASAEAETTQQRLLSAAASIVPSSMAASNAIATTTSGQTSSAPDNYAPEPAAAVRPSDAGRPDAASDEPTPDESAENVAPSSSGFGDDATQAPAPREGGCSAVVSYDGGALRIPEPATAREDDDGAGPSSLPPRVPHRSSLLSPPKNSVAPDRAPSEDAMKVQAFLDSTREMSTSPASKMSVQERRELESRARRLSDVNAPGAAPRGAPSTAPTSSSSRFAVSHNSRRHLQHSGDREYTQRPAGQPRGPLPPSSDQAQYAAGGAPVTSPDPSNPTPNSGLYNDQTVAVVKRPLDPILRQQMLLQELGRSPLSTSHAQSRVQDDQGHGHPQGHSHAHAQHHALAPARAHDHGCGQQVSAAPVQLGTYYGHHAPIDLDPNARATTRGAGRQEHHRSWEGTGNGGIRAGAATTSRYVDARSTNHTDVVSVAMSADGSDDGTVQVHDSLPRSLQQIPPPPTAAGNATDGSHTFQRIGPGFMQPGVASGSRTGDRRLNQTVVGENDDRLFV